MPLDLWSNDPNSLCVMLFTTFTAQNHRESRGCVREPRQRKKDHVDAAIAGADLSCVAPCDGANVTVLRHSSRPVLAMLARTERHELQFARADRLDSRTLRRGDGQLSQLRNGVGGTELSHSGTGVRSLHRWQNRLLRSGQCVGRPRT